MPDDTQKQGMHETPHEETYPNSSDISSSAPSDYFPPTPPSRAKAAETGKVVATFLGLLFLMGGLGMGVALVMQPQLLSQKASDITTEYSGPCANYAVNAHRCESGNTGRIQVCNSNHLWVSSECASHVCSNGACAPPTGSVGCFLAGTQVATSTGSKSIENVMVGDLVKSFDTADKVEVSNVSDLHKVTRDFYFHITTDTGSVDVTAEHPFYTGNGNYVEAQNLKVGELVYFANGGALSGTPITSVEKVNKLVDAYNLTVDDNHTFFANGFAVHNKLSGYACNPLQYFSSASSVCESKYGGGRPIASGGSCNSDEFNAGSIDYWSGPVWNKGCVSAECCMNTAGYNSEIASICANARITVHTSLQGISLGGVPVVPGVTSTLTVNDFTCKLGASSDCAKSRVDGVNDLNGNQVSVSSPRCNMGAQRGYCCP